MGFLVSGITGSYLQSMLGTALQGTRSASTTTRSPGLTSPTSVSQTPEVDHPSPFGVLLDTLQQLQQSDPVKFSQVTQQIANKLTSAAGTAQSSGNTTAANALSQLASDFTTASQNSQLPSIQDLASAVHLIGQHSQPSSSESGGSSNSTANQKLSQMLSGLQTDASHDSSLNPMSIILSTLSNAGIGGSIG